MARHESVDRHAFPTTIWTIIAQAGDDDRGARQAAVADFVRRYMPALRCYLVRHRRIRPDRADDLLQEFVSRKVLANDLIAQADRGRGRFRTFLLTSLNRFMASEFRYEHAGKRDARSTISIEAAADPPDSHMEPGAAFDVAWAREILNQAVERMKQQCAASGDRMAWDVFEARILDPIRGARPIPYADLVDRFGLKSPAQAANVLTRAKRTFRRCLRSVVAEYAEGEGAVDSEIDDLHRILAGAGRCA